MKAFVSNEYPTVGVEQEFHLIDPVTAELAPRVNDVFATLDGDLRKHVAYELFLSVLEQQSVVCRTIDELVDTVRRTRKQLAQACERVGVRLAAAGSHPFSRWQELEVVPEAHYAWVIEHCAYLSRRLLSFGLHVHVGMRSVESAMYALHEMRRWAYPLQALAANSPFYEGQRTGLASTRAHLFGAMPRTHLPPEFENFGQLELYYEKLLAAGDIMRPGDLWWIVRPQPPLGTLELRIFDMPTDVNRLGALAAVSQAAAAYYQDAYYAGTKQTQFEPGCLEQNCWKAMRYGLEGDILEPETGQVLSTPAQLTRLFDLVESKAVELGCANWLQRAREMLESGNETKWQLEQYEKRNGDLRALELAIADATIA